MWKDDELPEGYYKNLIRSLKENLDMREELVELAMLRKKVQEQEYLLSKEKELVMKLDNEIIKEKEHALKLQKKPDASMQEAMRLKIIFLCVVVGLFIWLVKSSN
ncbi:unnamed protein product [Lactuca virosa]|uniref:Uncharacterized protein n=1 Tax=Lactuca virosa TaxID=75947 RepID=A0AAU9NVF1_9ASTR|nr:unnamed protein product [Lactuca virosa]